MLEAVACHIPSTVSRSLIYIPNIYHLHDIFVIFLFKIKNMLLDVFLQAGMVLLAD